MQQKPIDFVICWVDGDDPAWIKEKDKYQPGQRNDNRDIRYRDWDILKYWFRGVENFAPWVNKIHFVTWGHVPKWLNVNHPKINIVKHEEYIPNEYLPTFSARPIEINLHRIEALAEQFVYFNDDMFILKPMKETDFFINGKPCDMGVMDIAIKPDEAHGSAVYNAINVINRHFNKSVTLNDNLFNWINPIYGKELLKTLLLMPWGYYTGFYTPHLPNSFLKSTYNEVWMKEYDLLQLTSSHKFRDKLDVTQYIFKFWQLASNNFVRRKNVGRNFILGQNTTKAIEAISNQSYKMICLNDSEEVEDIEAVKDKVISSFEKVFPELSSYETKH